MPYVPVHNQAQDQYFSNGSRRWFHFFLLLKKSLFIGFRNWHPSP